MSSPTQLDSWHISNSLALWCYLVITKSLSSIFYKFPLDAVSHFHYCTILHLSSFGNLFSILFPKFNLFLSYVIFISQSSLKFTEMGKNFICNKNLCKKQSCWQWWRHFQKGLNSLYMWKLSSTNKIKLVKHWIHIGNSRPSWDPFHCTSTFSTRKIHYHSVSHIQEVRASCTTSYGQWNKKAIRSRNLYQDRPNNLIHC